MHPILGKKLVISLILGGALIGGSYLVSTNAGERFSYRSNSSAASVELKTLISQDSDGDGIKDWEEALWGTDPENADSDSDGTQDAVEIATLRTAAGISTTTIAVGGKAGSETDAFAREIFASALGLKQSGQLTDASVESLSSVLLEQFATTTFGNLYGKEDLKLSSGDAASKEAYRSAITPIFKRYAPYNLGSELSVISEALGGAPSRIDALSSYALSYERLAKELSAVPVPSPIIEAHLNAINGMAAVARSLRTIQEVFENPLPGYVALIEYVQNEGKANDALRTIASYLK